MTTREFIEFLKRGNLSKQDNDDLPEAYGQVLLHEIGHSNSAAPAETAKPKAEDDELWTPEEMVKIMKQTRRWLYEHAANGELPFARYTNGQGRKGLRFDKKGYREWLDSRATKR
jgi:hypothetical protein